MLNHHFLTTLLALRLAAAAPIAKRQVSAPLLQVDFPDPAQLLDGDTWYIFASQSKFDNKDIHIQLAQSIDNLGSFQLQAGYDALDGFPAWAVDNGETWAPDVNRLSDGTFLMYFSATPSAAPGSKCVGTARSSTIRGPYKPDDQPFDCSTDQGGAIDASGFAEGDKRYVTWKIDANSIGHGGSCGNTVEPIVSTPILVQEVQQDGVTKIGSPSTLIVNDPADGPDVEGPVIMKKNDEYILFFSNNCYNTELYTQSYATSSSISSGYVKAARPLYTLGDYGMSGPGGGTPTEDGAFLVFHALETGGRRFPHVGTLTFDGTGASTTIQG